jgi:hypothetical protein
VRPLPMDREWSIGLDLRGTGWDRNDQNPPNTDLKGNQFNMTGGIGRKITPDFLIGIITGYESFKYDMASLGTLRGEGGTTGAYAAWRLTSRLRWDASIGWSKISNDDVAGVVRGSFGGTRWLFSSGLAGSYHYAWYVLEPSTRMYAVWEKQSAWINSLATAQYERSSSARGSRSRPVGKSFVVDLDLEDFGQACPSRRR